MKMAETIDNYTVYRDRPLVKSGSVICYGDPSDKAILVLTVLTTKEFKGCEIPDLIFIQILDTKTNDTLKQAEKYGLYNALDLGSTWLDRELKKN